jgi:hypothetical protein
MPLFSWQKNKEDENKIEISMSEEDKKRLDTATTAAAELPAIKERLASLDSINAYFEEMKKDREAERAAAARKAAEAAASKGSEDLEELFLTDPKAAVERATSGQTQAILTLNAANVKREVFEDADKYKYYHGSIKDEVDKLIAGQSLQARNDASVVENCYRTVLGRHTDELLEGKIKTRFAGSESSTRGTNSGAAGSSAAGSKEPRVIPDDVRKIAKSFGIPAEEYADMLDKEGIGYA